MTTHFSGNTLSGSPELALVFAALDGVIDPEIRLPITELDMLRDVSIDELGHVTLTLVLTIPGCPAASTIEAHVRSAVNSVSGITGLTLFHSTMTPDERDALTSRLRGSQNREFAFGPESLTTVIAVSSGKGGVGKSTVTANLAVTLSKLGRKVGIVDADIHGFSIPGLMGLVEKNAQQHLTIAPTRIGKLMLPPIAFGVKVISIGMFLDAASGSSGSPKAVAWRGPLLHRALKQMLDDVYFGDLDFLLIDLPPGTGDVAISLGQLIPHAKILLVTTPQPAASEIAARSAIVARQMGQELIGVIENMAGFVHTDGSIIDIFGSGGGETLAHSLSTSGTETVPLLARIPLDVSLREGGDSGSPVVLSHPDSPAAHALNDVASHILRLKRGLNRRKLPLNPS